jgi:hypothetical protein
VELPDDPPPTQRESPKFSNVSDEAPDPTASAATGKPANGNGADHSEDDAQYASGSKSEAEQDTHAEEHADEPFDDIFLLRKGYRLARVFDYTLADGTLLYQQNRYELKPDIPALKVRPRKRFLVHRKVNGAEVFGAGNRLVPYNWPAIMRAGPGRYVFVPEGENKVEALSKAGWLATTVLSHKWMPECVAALTGQHLIILEDHDDEGKALSADAQKKLAPIAASTRIVPALHLWKHLPNGAKPQLHDDVVDWITREHGDAKKLLDICREIPVDGIIAAKPYQFPAEIDIPQWAWLYGWHLLRGEVAGTAAMGGTGKSTLSIVEALAMTSGRALLGPFVPTPLRVVLINLEDTRNTIDKRIAAVMRQHGLTATDISDRLIVIAKGEVKVKIAKQRRSHRRVDPADARAPRRCALDRQFHPHPSRQRERQLGDPGGGRVLRGHRDAGTVRRASMASHPQERRRKGNDRKCARRRRLHRCLPLGPHSRNDVRQGTRATGGDRARHAGARVLLPRLQWQAQLRPAGRSVGLVQDRELGAGERRQCRRGDGVAISSEPSRPHS